MCKWAKEHIREIHCHFISNKQIQQPKKKLDKRFKNAAPVTGIRSCHIAIPILNDIIKIKTLPTLQEGQDFRLKNINIYEFVDEPAIKTR